MKCIPIPFLSVTINVNPWPINIFLCACGIKYSYSFRLMLSSWRPYYFYAPWLSPAFFLTLRWITSSLKNLHFYKHINPPCQADFNSISNIFRLIFPLYPLFNRAFAHLRPFFRRDLWPLTFVKSYLIINYFVFIRVLIRGNP